MKTSIRLLLGFQALLWLCSACTKSDVPTPDKTFREVNITMEEHIQNERPGSYYSYFVYQNDSDYNLYLSMNTDYLHDMIIQYIEPGEQVTRWVTMGKYPGYTQNEILIEDLTALGWIDFFPNALTPEELSKADRISIPNDEQDTCATYTFENLTPHAPMTTPKDPTQWTFEKFSDHRVRWTYRVTNAIHDEAVRQTLERWKDRPQPE